MSDEKRPFDYYSADLDGVEIPKRSRKELATLHSEALSGSVSAWEDLWLHGTKLVLKICHTLRERDLLRISFEDAVAEGNLAIGEALTRWNPKKSSFSTWVWIRIRGSILNQNSDEALSGMVGDVESRPQVLPEEFEHSNGEKPAMANSWFDLADIPEEDNEQLVFMERVLDAIQELPERERHFVTEVYIFDRPQAAVAAEAGVSRPRVRQVLDRAIERLREILEV